eukprot:COSAG01_NODE_1641_length_9647_cov_5.299539_7_plen_103_part_00
MHSREIKGGRLSDCFEQFLGEHVPAPEHDDLGRNPERTEIYLRFGDRDRLICVAEQVHRFACKHEADAPRWVSPTVISEGVAVLAIDRRLPTVLLISARFSD